MKYKRRVQKLLPGVSVFQVRETEFWNKCRTLKDTEVYKCPITKSQSLVKNECVLYSELFIRLNPNRVLKIVQFYRMYTNVGYTLREMTLDVFNKKIRCI